ncbi:MAG: pitrilysin family protein [Pseudomonadota bacterium]
MATQTFTLENGMQVILEENHAAKVVSFNALVKVGSANETDKEAGICHVIEHMLFKGTPTRPAGTIARDVEAAGGEINAYTSIDQTVFYINMATRFADRGLSILADAVLNPLFDAEELEREKEVILEEIRRENDNPGRMATEHLFHTAFATHTYGRPIIGFPNTVKSFTRAEILDFYRRWYSPRNIVFIAVGDFETGKALADIRAQFAPARGSEAPSGVAVPEPPQTGFRLMVKPMNIQSAYLSLGFHIPEITHADIPALDALSHIMGGADSSRLEQEIKEKQRLVHNIYSYAFTPKDPGLLVVGAMLADRDVEKAIKAIRREVDRLKEETVGSEELSRAKLNIRSNEIYEKETVGGQAGKLAYFLATAGNYEFEKRYYQMLSDVGIQTVREAAERYLSFDNCTAVLLVPEGSAWVKSKAPLERALAPSKKLKVAAAARAVPKPEKIRLKNGATMIVIENHNLPLVAMCAAVPGGTRFETRKNNGISGLLSRTLTKGTESRTAIDIARDIEKMAGHIDAFAGRNTVGLKCEFLSEHLDDGFDLFADILANPSFSADEVAKERRLVLQAIKDQEDALSAFTFAEFLKTLFPKHPYGLRTIGTVEAVKKLTRADLVRYHRGVVRAGNLALTVVGDVSRQEVERLANEMLAGLPKGKSAAPKLAIDPPPSTIRETFVKKREKQQAHIVLGFQGTTYKSRDRYTMSVLNNIMAGQGGRLFATLRDKMSLAYAVSSMHQEGIEPGYFAVYIGTDPAKEKKAIKGILEELKRICAEAVSEDEIDRSKQYLVGAYELDMQRSGTLAGLYAFNEVYGLDMGEIERYPARILAITRDDVLRVARRYIHPDAYTLAVVKPA